TPLKLNLFRGQARRLVIVDCGRLARRGRGIVVERLEVTTGTVRPQLIDQRLTRVRVGRHDHVGSAAVVACFALAHGEPLLARSPAPTDELRRETRAFGPMPWRAVRCLARPAGVLVEPRCGYICQC